MTPYVLIDIYTHSEVRVYIWDAGSEDPFEHMPYSDRFFGLEASAGQKYTDVYAYWILRYWNAVSSIFTNV